MNFILSISPVLNNTELPGCVSNIHTAENTPVLEQKSENKRRYTKYTNFVLKPDGSKKRPYNRAPKPNKRLDCDVCKESFGTKYDLRKHQLIHIKKDPSIKINTENGLSMQTSELLKINHECQNDVGVVHQEFACEICKKKFQKESYLHHHYQIHTQPKDVSCVTCRMPFKSKAGLQEHYRIFYSHKVPISFSCNMCPNTYTTKASLTNHMHAHAREKKNSSSTCTETFETSSELQNHESQMNCKKMYDCGVCEKTYSDEESLKSHLKLHAKGLFSCNVCTDKFSTKFKLKKHQDEVHNESKVLGSEIKVLKRKQRNNKCQTTFQEEVSMKLHGTEQNELFLCNVCEKTFYTECDLNEHKLSVHNNMDVLHDCGEHLCKVCLISFVDEKSLRAHSASHTKGKKNSCHICSEYFHLQSDLKYHLKSHAVKKKFNNRKRCKQRLRTKPLRTYPDKSLASNLCRASLSRKKMYRNNQHMRKNMSSVCNICHLRFSRQVDLNTHNQQHTEGKSYTSNFSNKDFKARKLLYIHKKAHIKYFCSICHKGFAFRSYLIKHYKIHIKGKPLTCDICKKRFTVKSHLFHHYHSHTDVKPYVCSVCQKVFRFRINFKMHCRSHVVIQNTLPQKPFICQLCKKKFYNRSILQLHYRAHTGEKPFVCDFCPKAYAFRQCLINHMRIHTIERKHICNKYDNSFKTKHELQKHKCSSQRDIDSNALHSPHLSCDIKCSKEKSFLCNICKEKFETTFALEVHKLIHMTEDDYIPNENDCISGANQAISPDKVNSQACDATFMNDKLDISDCNKNMFNTGMKVDRFNTHIKEEVFEIDKNEYLCKMCSMSFMDKESLESHSFIHKNDKEPIFNAHQNTLRTILQGTNHHFDTFSKKTASNEKDLEINTEPSEHGFNICIKQEFFESEIDTDNHKYVCAICNTVFVDEESLQLHSVEHKKDKECMIHIGNTITTISDETNCHSVEHSERQTSIEEEFEINTVPNKQACNIYIKEEGFENAMDIDNHKYLCAVWHTTFTDEESLQSHSAIHKTDELIDTSQNAFRTTSEETNYHSVEHNERCDSEGREMLDALKFVCDICQMSFCEKESLLSHYTVHKKGILFFCNLCSKTFGARRNLKRHILFHTYKKPYACDKCPKTFLLESYLIKHKSVHSQWKAYACGACNESFKSKSGLKNHLFLKHKSDYLSGMCQIKSVVEFSPLSETKKLQQFSCNICKRVFRSIIDLKGHEGIHTTRKDLGLEFPINTNDYTSKVYQTVSSNEGNQLIHLDNESIICNTCQKRFKTRAEWKEHVICIHNKKSDQQNHSYSAKNCGICEICQEVFADEKSLQWHIARSFHCDICQKPFKNCFQLKMHNLAAHTSSIIPKDEKTDHVCDVCCTACSKKEMSHHYKRHKKGELFNCHLCSKNFILKDTLKKHLMYHTGGKKFNLEMFTKVQTNKGYLKRHILIPKDSKPFTCNTCKKEFETKYELWKHQIKQHKLQYLSNTDQAAFILEEALLSSEKSVNDNKFPCGSSKQKSETTHALKEHELMDAEAEAPTECKNAEIFFCSVCKRDFSGASELKEHKLSHIIKKDLQNDNPINIKKEYVCGICQAVFSEEKNLLLHCAKHSNIELFNCNTHDMAFTSNIQLQKHKVRKQDEVLKSNTAEKQSNKSKMEFSEKNSPSCVTASYELFSQKTFQEQVENSSVLHKFTFNALNDKKVSENESNHDKNQYECDICLTFYMKEDELKLHYSIHRKSGNFICHLCSRVFTKKDPLKRHLALHKSKKLHFCDKCPMTYSRESYLLKHKSVHTGENPYICSLCCKRFKAKVELKSHQLQIHERKTPLFSKYENKNPLSCYLCKKEFPTNSELKIHMMIHSKMEEMKLLQNEASVGMNISKLCHEIVDIESLQPHYDTHTCGTCDEVFVSTIKLKEHEQSAHTQEDLKTQTDTEQKEYVTQACATISSEGILQSDIEAIDKPFVYDQKFRKIKPKLKIDETNKDYNSKDSKCHFDNSKYICDICLTIFAKEEELYYHYSMHKNGELYTCHLCPLTSLRKDALKKHLAFHKISFRYSCKICSKPCSSQFSLQRHLQSHTSEKQYTCNDNGKGFNKRYQLKNHQHHMHSILNSQSLKQKSVNPDTVPSETELKSKSHFTCSHCEKEFKTNLELEQHEVTHIKKKLLDEASSNKDYMCRICQKTFPDDICLKLHSIIHENNEAFSCDTCVRKFKSSVQLTKHRLSFHKQQKASQNLKNPVKGEHLSEFRDTKGLQSNTVHSNKKPFICEVCQKSFKTNPALKSHKRNIHKILK